MLNLLLALTSSFYFPCSDCLAQFKQVKSETLKLQPVSPITNSPCTSGGNVWTNVAKNKWLSDKGIALKIIENVTYKTLPFARFWESENALEAHTILAKAAPGEEVSVFKFFWRSANAWLYYTYADEPKCLSFGGMCEPSKYVIHYLHRPKNDWVIDLLTSHAVGFIESRLDENRQREYYITYGPYTPIYEGRFKHNGAIFWFSATDTRPVERLTTTTIPSENLSTPEERYETLRSINNLVKFCIKAQD